MPVLTYEGVTLSQEQKEAMIKGLTEVADKVLPETPKSAFYVFFREYPPEKVGVGGMPLPDYIKSLSHT